MRRPSRLLTRAIKLFILLSGKLAAVIPVVLLVGVLWASFPARDVAPGVTADRIQQVRLGMTPAQVVATLGKPLNEIGSYRGQYPRNVARNPDFARLPLPETSYVDGDRLHDQSCTFIYTRPGGFFRTYPMLWVHFDKQARVNNVYAKEYGADDQCIYSLTLDTSQSMSNLAALQRLFDNEH